MTSPARPAAMASGSRSSVSTGVAAEGGWIEALSATTEAGNNMKSLRTWLQTLLEWKHRAWVALYFGGLLVIGAFGWWEILNGADRHHTNQIVGTAALIWTGWGLAMWLYWLLP